MTHTRTVAYDAAFMIAYIGFTAAMVALSLTLLGLLAMGAEFGALHVAAALVNLMGWATLPFAPRLYRSFVGHTFSWRANTAIGDIEL
jgi:CHASE2 domain-containing sensor protein